MPSHVASAVACAYGGVRDSVQMRRCSRRQRCRQILRALRPRRILLCAQARPRSCESRRPLSSARAAGGTMQLSQVCGGGVCRHVRTTRQRRLWWLRLLQALRLTDMSESAMVRSSARPWRGFGFGVGLAGPKGAIRHNASMPTCCRLVHGGSCISVACRCTEHAARYLAACCMHHASCCMLHDASGAQGELLDLVCGGNLTDFPRGFSSTVCRTCRTLTSMVLPHLPAIVRLHRQVSSTRPSPHLRRARTLPRGLRRAPSPHLPREPAP